MKKMISLLATLVAMSGVMMVSAGSASASAFGCQYIGGFGFSYQGLTLQAPQGYLCHQIEGSGRRVTNEWAGYGPQPSLYGALTGRVCNWRIDFQYRRADTGAVYSTLTGPTNYSCTYKPERSYGTDRTLAYYGPACARLFVNAVLRSQQCHNITG